MIFLKDSAHMVQSTRVLKAPTATFLTTTAKMSMGNLMGKAASAVLICTVNASHGAQYANAYLMILTILKLMTLTGLVKINALTHSP